MEPVGVAELQAVLDEDLAGALATGALAAETQAGVVIGVVQRGMRRVFAYGPAKAESVFEIGSVTKTFTGLLLAQMVEQKLVRLDEPVRELLPAGTVAKPEGREISLLDLSIQHTRLPRLPGNLNPQAKNPYSAYDAKLLYAAIAEVGVARADEAGFNYSNFGVGLLGQVLADRAGTTYAALLREQITGPLGMEDTGVALTPAMRARLIEGHDRRHNVTPGWDFDALAGAGAIRSTAADMLTYLEAQLHPEEIVLAAPEGKTLGAAIARTHEVQATAVPGMQVGLNWLRVEETGSFWHNGATGGYSAYAMFHPEQDFAVVVLSNATVGPGSITDALGLHVAQRLMGKPAVLLTP